MDEPVVDTEQADSEPQRRSGPWNLILLVVVVTLLGIWLVPGEDPAPVPVPVPQPRAPVPVADPPQPQRALPVEPTTDQAGNLPMTSAPADTAAPPAEVSPQVDDSPGGGARQLIAQMRASGQGSLEQIFAAAQKAEADGAYPDAYLLHFFAARKGHAPSAMVLAHQSDPAHFVAGQGLLDVPDLSQAHKWYRIAAETGNAEAKTKLAALRVRIERMAADGDPEAQRIALQWQ